MMTYLLPLLAMALAQSPCEPLSGEWIHAADIARTNPVFKVLQPETPIGRAPMAGARRVFLTEELARLARRYQLPAANLHSVCFAWVVNPPDPAKLIAAMARSLGSDESAVELVEYSRFPVPEGMFVFAKENLNPVQGVKSGLLLWKGIVRYAGNRSTPVWARVRITGIETQSVRRLPEVKAGDLVQLEVRRGPLTIRTEGRAERTGRTGDLIPLTNLASGTKLMARIEGKGKLSITVH